MLSLNDVLGFYKRKILPGLKVDKNAFVVDFGSGDKPFWRADVYVDMLSVKNNQRATRGKVVKSFGKFVNADLHTLPFKNQSFDFSFASHVIEHVEDPKKVLKEIMRVSKAGYMEFPNGFFETLSPAPSHLWCIYLLKNELVFVRKNKKMQEIFFENKLINKNIASHMKTPFVSFYWKKKINFSIIDTKTRDKFIAKHEKFSKKDHYSKMSPYITIVKILRYFLYKKKTIPESLLQK